MDKTTSLSFPSQDFLVGACFALGSVVFYHVYRFFHIPSVDKMVKIATEPVPLLGDNTKITIWGLLDSKEHEGTIDEPSPYVLRVEHYLRLKKQPYEKKKSLTLNESPRQKVPVANIYGTMVDDSRRILDQLQKRLGDDVDSKLNDMQRAQALLVRRVLTGSLYWIILYQTFATNHGREWQLSEMKRDAPMAVVALLRPFIIRSQLANLHGILDKYTPEEIYEFGKADLKALNTILGDNKYFFGLSEPSVYDTDVYSFVGPLFFDHWLSSQSWLQDISTELTALKQHAIRMKALLFGDSKKDQ